MGLLPTNARIAGSVRLGGASCSGSTTAQLSEIRGKQISMIFQDPLSALTPVYTVGDQIAEALLIHNDGMTKRQAHERAVELLDLVGIPNPKQRANAFPHEFSGGMRQRVMIAMAIANDPDVIIADEPTTALDVTIQAQILEVLQTAQRETGAAIIMITHDLGVVAGLADRVMVMYAGKPVEIGTADEIYYQPADAVHDGPARLDPAHRRARRIVADADRGQPAVAGRAAAGLPVRAALPAGDRRVPRDRARARADRRRRATWRPATASRRSRPTTSQVNDVFPAPEIGPAADRPHPARAARAGARARRARAALPADQGRGVQAAGRHGARGRRHRPRHPRGRDARAGRRVGLRQDDDAAADPRAQRAASGIGAHQRARHPRSSSAANGAASGATCRSSSRTRWPRSTRGCRSATSSPSRCARTACTARRSTSARPSCSSWSGSTRR